MLAVESTMDREFPQHEAQPAGSMMCSLSPLQSPRCGPSVQVSPSPQDWPWGGTLPSAGNPVCHQVPHCELLGFFCKDHDWPSGSYLGLVATFTCGTGTPAVGHVCLFFFNIWSL